MDGIVDAGPHLIVWLLAIAGAGLGLLGCVFGATSRLRHRGLQRRIAEIEDARRSERERLARQARLRASIEQQVEVKWFLTIQNHGPAAARNLTASINGAPLDDCPLVDKDACDLARLGAVSAHHGVRIPLHAAERPVALQVELTWSDEAGELGFYRATLPDDATPAGTSMPAPTTAEPPDPDL